MPPAIAIAVMLLLGGCGDDADRRAAPDPAEFAAQELTSPLETRTATTTSEPSTIIDPSEVPGAPIDRYSLDVGDCFDFFDVAVEGGSESRTTQLPCTEPHHHEIFHRFSYPAEHPSVFPGDAVVRDYAFQVCYREFETWVGSEYELSSLEIGVITPPREFFEDDRRRYRGVHCWVERVDGEPMIGTSRGSGW